MKPKQHLPLLLAAILLAGCGSSKPTGTVASCSEPQRQEHPYACEQAAAQAKQREQEQNRAHPGSRSAQFELFQETQARAKQNLAPGETYVTVEDEQRAREEVEAEQSG